MGPPLCQGEVSIGGWVAHEICKLPITAVKLAMTTTINKSIQEIFRFRDMPNKNS